MNEPLKNKIKFFEYWGNKKQLNEPHKFNAAYEEDIKSAVEWLLNQVDERNAKAMDLGWGFEVSPIYIEFKLLIKQAFQDVTNKEVKDETKQ